MGSVKIRKSIVTTALVGSFILSGMGNVVFAESGFPSAKSKTEVSVLSASGDVTIFIDGSYPQPPVVENGSTLVPLRGIFEALGANVIWDGENQTVYAYKVLNRSSIAVTLKIGQNTATVNGVQKELAAPAKVVNGSTLVPLRFISEALGAKVSWDDTSRTAKIDRADAFEGSNQTVPVDNFTKQLTLIESNRSEEELIPNLKKAFEELKISLDTYAKASDDNNELTQKFKSVFKAYSNVTVQLFAIDRKMDYYGWENVSRLSSVLDGYLPVVDNVMEMRVKSDWQIALIQTAKQNVHRVSDKVALMKKSPESIKGKYQASDAVAVRYGAHSYNSLNQNEYDTVMRIVDEALKNIPDAFIGSDDPHGYAQYWGEYLDGARIARTDDRMEWGLRDIALSSADDEFKNLVAAGVAKDKIIKLYNLSSVAFDLKASGLYQELDNGASWNVTYLGGKVAGVRKSPTDFELTLSPYDVLGRHLNNVRSTEPYIWSAVFDAAGYNTAIVDGNMVFELNGAWWYRSGSSFVKTKVMQGYKAKEINSQPTYGPPIH